MEVGNYRTFFLLNFLIIQYNNTQNLLLDTQFIVKSFCAFSIIYHTILSQEASTSCTQNLNTISENIHIEVEPIVNSQLGLPDVS